MCIRDRNITTAGQQKVSPISFDEASNIVTVNLAVRDSQLFEGFEGCTIKQVAGFNKMVAYFGKNDMSLLMDLAKAIITRNKERAEYRKAHPQPTPQ